ncbi:MAG: OsmC family protein [Planctomycetaceae bacterium]
MNADELKQRQAPLKARYKEDPSAARQIMRVEGTLDPAHLRCELSARTGPLRPGLHPAAGGDGQDACSADMLLEALAGCASVTLLAVATSLGIPIEMGKVVAEGDLDFRGTLGVSREAPVGFEAIRLKFTLSPLPSAEQLGTLAKLCERYCVVAQSLKTPITISIA